MGVLWATNAISDDSAEQQPRVSIVISLIQPINLESESVAVELTSGLVRALAEYPDVELLTMLELVPGADGEDPSGRDSSKTLILTGGAGWIDGHYEAHFKLADLSANGCSSGGRAVSNNLGLIVELMLEPIVATMADYRDGGALDGLRQCCCAQTEKACSVRGR